MRTDGAHFDALARDLEAARDEVIALASMPPEAWTRSRPGHWTAGQHLEHVALMLERGASDFGAALERQRRGALPPPPGRGPLQSLFVEMVVRRGMMPRGGKAPSLGTPSTQPSPADVSSRIRSAVERLLAIGRGLDPGARDALWIRNPYTSFHWVYRYPEMLRIQAVHFRHHGAQARELAER